LVGSDLVHNRCFRWQTQRPEDFLKGGFIWFRSQKGDDLEDFQVGPDGTRAMEDGYDVLVTRVSYGFHYPVNHYHTYNTGYT